MLMTFVSDSFYTLNTSDGSATFIGAHGLTANFAQGMTYDREAGELYAYIYTRWWHKYIC